MCPHCGEKTSSILHLWECTALKDFRRLCDKDLADMNPCNTPHHLLIGIPEAFDAGITGDFCVGARDGKLGDIFLHSMCSYRANIPLTLEHVILEHLGDDRTLDHMQLAYKYLSTAGETDLPVIGSIHGSLPALANTASDGSLKFSGKGLALGSFGTWEPDR